MPKIIAFIPIRSGSKSIPNKNIKMFNGKPLVHWSIEAALDCESIDEVIVASDYDETQIAFPKTNPKLKYYERETHNAEDTSSTESVVLEFLKKNNYHTEDKFVLIQATNPLFTSKDLYSAIEKAESDISVISCARVKRFFWSDEGEPINYDYKHRPRRQDFMGTLVENGAFYINRIGGIIQDKNRLSKPIKIYEMPEYTYVEIDEESDWMIAEKIHKKYILTQ